MTINRVFIGYDHREGLAFHVLSHSIHRRTFQPLTIAPVMLNQVMDVFQRPRDSLQSTAFSFSRFLVPYLCGYKGWAIFMDCDMLMRGNVSDLFDMRDERFAVQVVKHHHVPKEQSKFLNEPQTVYQKKNWSSVMLMNCARCLTLTPAYVKHASGLELHQFKWLKSDDEIGELPKEWNHLVGYDAPNPDAKLVHFTSGGPYFSDYRNCEFAEEWRTELRDMLEVME